MKWSDIVRKGKPFSTDIVGYFYMLAGGFAADVFEPHTSQIDYHFVGHLEKTDDDGRYGRRVRCYLPVTVPVRLFFKMVLMVFGTALEW
jgi:hypothetical protein